MEDNTPDRIGFGKRLGAYLLDLVIYLTMAALVIMGLTQGYFGDEVDPAFADGGDLLGKIFGLLKYAMYTNLCYLPILLMDALLGQSPGKMVLGIQIANSDGTKASLGKLLGRAGIKYLQSLFHMLFWVTGLWFFSTLKNIATPVVFIGYLLALGKAKQALHDMIVKTAVFKKSDIREPGTND